MPTTVPNQNIVHIHRDMPQSGDRDFLVVKNQNLYDAYKTLRQDKRGGLAIYLWLVLAGNKDGYDLAFSPKAILERSGLPESTCRDAVDRLIRNGYLVQKREGSNIYDFYERPEFATQKSTHTVTEKAQPVPEEKEVAEKPEIRAQHFVF